MREYESKREERDCNIRKYDEKYQIAIGQDEGLRIKRLHSTSHVENLNNLTNRNRRTG